MGGGSKPATPPKPIPPPTAEDGQVKAAGDDERRRLRNLGAREGTYLVDSGLSGAGNKGSNTLISQGKTMTGQ